MKILVAGATGALGRQLLPRLAAAGHEVVGTTRRPAKCESILSLGATPAVMDALSAEDVARVVAEAEPEVVVHQLTDLTNSLGKRVLDRGMAGTNRLRTEATDHLLAAARAAGVRRFVAQSYAGTGLPYPHSGAAVRNEDDAVDPQPPRGMRQTIAAIRYLEDAVTGWDGGDGIVLRYGSFYGPGTAFAPNGQFTELIRRRQFPIIGSGGGVWSFVHVEDAAEATVTAIERGGAGIFNIVDDEPAPVATWLPAAAAAIGAAPPLRLPQWLGTLLAGRITTAMMTEARGASNAKARRELGWAPHHASWRDGFVQVAAS